MRLTISIVFLGTFLNTTSCISENSDCHFSFEIRNNSQDTVFTQRSGFKDTLAHCELQKNMIAPGKSLETRLKNTCWENELRATNGVFQIFFYNTNGEIGKPYSDCDDDLLNQQILERREITIDYLRANNWIINYP
jgi:hypothetical protein